MSMQLTLILAKKECLEMIIEPTLTERINIRERKRTEPNRTRTDFQKMNPNRTKKGRFDSLSGRQSLHDSIMKSPYGPNQQYSASDMTASI